jgi:hypothetical protein
MSARKFDLYRPKGYGNVRIEHDEIRVGKVATVRLHSTAVVQWNRTQMQVRLHSGGWRTVTTKTAINTAMRQIPGPLGKLGVYQERGDWYVTDGQGNTWDFKDGDYYAISEANGQVINLGTL